MPISLQFDVPFVDLKTIVRKEKDLDKLTHLLRLILRMHNYPASAITRCNFASARLAAGAFHDRIGFGPDLICQLGQQGYSEVILHDDYGLQTYGGYLINGKNFEILDEVENGHHVVLVTHEDRSVTRHVYLAGVGYEPVFEAPVPD